MSDGLETSETSGKNSNGILLLSERDIRRSVSLDQVALNSVADGFSSLANGKATVPPIMMIEVPEQEGEIDVKAAYLKGLDSLAIKIASGFSRNSAQGLANSSGMMILVSTLTGFPAAVLLDNGYLTDLRTAVAGAIAAKYLACKKITTVGVIGVGLQARFQVRALQLVRHFDRVLVFGRDAEATRKYVDDMTGELGVKVEATATIEALIEQSDVVVTTTPSKRFLIRSEWLHPGLHITAMGADTPEKQELEPTVLAKADLVVCDRKEQCRRLGEIHFAVASGALTDADVNKIVELGELTSAQKPGRENDSAVTVCILTGVGVQDTAIARLAYHRAVDQRLGVYV